MVASWVAQASFEPLGMTIAVAKDRAIESLMQVRRRDWQACLADCLAFGWFHLGCMQRGAQFFGFYRWVSTLSDMCPGSSCASALMFACNLPFIIVISAKSYDKMMALIDEFIIPSMRRPSASSPAWNHAARVRAGWRQLRAQLPG